MRQTQDRIAIYSRKSKFTGKGESIGNQIELCREYIRGHYGGDHAETALLFEDEGFSGGNVNRPAFQKMLRQAREGEFKAIIVYRLDRISRNVSDFSNLIEELNRMGVAFVSIREQFDTGTPMGRAMMYIASVFSQLERETIAERIRDNMRELAKTGRWLGGVTPTGYASESVKSVTVDGKTKRTCRLRLIPEEAETVRLIYALFGETDSLTDTEAELLRRRVVTKNGKSFTRFSIKAILQNPVYLMADQAAHDYFLNKQADLFSGPEEFDGVHGVLAYNRTDQQKGRAAVSLPVSEWIVSVGRHPGLIPSGTWIRTQEALERNRSGTYRHSRGNEALLTGLLFCRCGSRMYPKLSKRTAGGGPAYTYVCKLKERSKKSLCACRNVGGNALDGAVMERIGQLSEDAGCLIGRLEQSRKDYIEGRDRYEKELAGLGREREDKEKKIAALVDALAELGDGEARSRVARRIEELHRGKEALAARAAELKAQNARQAPDGAELDRLCRLLSGFQSSVEGMTLEQKRAAVRAVVRRVVWDGQCAHVALCGAEYPVNMLETPLGEDSK